MNEFDSYVRHVIRPLAYLRYGDDFLVFGQSEVNTTQARLLSIGKLQQLGLKVNDRQDQTVRAWQGLHFLGHVVNKEKVIINRKTRNLMTQRVNPQNISSYSSLKLNNDTKRKLPWLIDI